MEMNSNLTQKVVSDPRVSKRLQELGLPGESVPQLYQESLILENSPEKLREQMTESEAGSKEANIKLIQGEIFNSARVLSMLQMDLGKQLYGKLLDAIKRPEDISNLELVLKEVGYQRQVDVTQEELLGISGAEKNLNTPL